jgi:hypothetical protein
VLSAAHRAEKQPIRHAIDAPYKIIYNYVNEKDTKQNKTEKPLKNKRTK